MASNQSSGWTAVALLDALGIGEVIIAGFDWGARTANVVAALWPGRCKAMVSVSGYLIGSPAAHLAPLLPRAELGVVVSVLFRHRTGRRGLAYAILARVRQPHRAHGLAPVEIRRRDVVAGAPHPLTTQIMSAL